MVLNRKLKIGFFFCDCEFFLFIISFHGSWSSYIISELIFFSKICEWSVESFSWWSFCVLVSVLRTHHDSCWLCLCLISHTAAIKKRFNCKCEWFSFLKLSCKTRQWCCVCWLVVDSYLKVLFLMFFFLSTNQCCFYNCLHFKLSYFVCFLHPAFTQ